MTTSDQDLLSGTTTLDALRRLVDDVAALVDTVDDDTWQAASPCPDLPVRDLVGHLVGGLAGFTRVARHEGGPAFDGPAVDRPAAAGTYREAARAAVSAWSVPGRLDEVFAMPWGDTTGGQLVGFLVVEQAGHGWDLARALGRPVTLDERAVAVADGVAHAMITPQMRMPGMFGPEVATTAGAPTPDRLAAFLGRHP